VPLRIGILPHADLPHVIPCFRVGRELLKLGHEVHILGSDIYTLGRTHSEACRDQLPVFGLSGRQVFQKAREISFFDWLIRQLKELELDVLILDAAWQSLSFRAQTSGLLKSIIVHHAGFPDFRSRDLPPWRFIHPGLSKEQQRMARRSVAADQAAQAFRTMFSSIKATSGAGPAGANAFEFVCNEFASLPAVRAISLCPALEFPDERGRIDYFGTLLPTAHDIDWRSPPAELIDSSETLIVCAFGTTAILTPEERQWLAALATTLARSFPLCQVIAAIPDQSTSADPSMNAPENLLSLPWFPLWELLSARKGTKVLVSTPGVGAFREAVASATPVVALPRGLDQFGAAARVEYFNLGSALVSPGLPPSELVVRHVAHVLENETIQAQVRRFKQEIDAFDATLPLKRAMESSLRDVE
jgi:UDP:flavonoid glycosyltransferase YjiC (YdhE family)